MADGVDVGPADAALIISIDAVTPQAIARTTSAVFSSRDTISQIMFGRPSVDLVYSIGIAARCAKRPAIIISECVIGHLDRPPSRTVHRNTAPQIERASCRERV